MATDSNLTEIILPTTLKQFVEVAWRSGDFTNEFLSEKLLEKEVLITDWSVISSRDDKNIKYERNRLIQKMSGEKRSGAPMVPAAANQEVLLHCEDDDDKTFNNK